MCIRDSRVHGKTKTQTINFPLMQYQVSFPPVLNLLNNANLQNLMSLNHIDREYDDRRTSSTNDSDHDSAFGSMSPPSLIPANKDRQGSAQRPKNKSFLIKKKTEVSLFLSFPESHLTLNSFVRHTTWDFRASTGTSVPSPTELKNSRRSCTFRSTTKPAAASSIMKKRTANTVHAASSSISLSISKAEDSSTRPTVSTSITRCSG
eukprot:TRINITY_DN2827_c0_g1_i3.p1 TRINITY_DN2827_c0_g1~~TRINITY_DN2827_c0_g1_i3.p1  ORF type:complete len:206 (+),score=17.62 TRINITY_DN2827_c0_g1_i3:3-620(+)